MTLFTPTTKMQPRPYQAEAIDALDKHLCTKETNPCVVIPTAGGKSPIMAWTIQRFKQSYPPFRCIVLAHVKELVEQNADKMRQVWPEAPIGIFAAGLKKRQRSQCITFASIDSVYNRADQFDPFDLIMVDEAHRIPARGEGKYRRFIADAKLQNPNLRVVGFTATPYRLGCGPICHKDHILHEVCYEANVRDLIEQGYLCRLRSKIAEHQPDVSNVRKSGGDYVNKALAEAVDVPSVVSEAIREAMAIINAENRKSIIFFCVNIEHCKHVSYELRKYGIDAPFLTGKTRQSERDRITRRFVDGEIRAICNVNVLTEGFDATRTDAVVLLRPTKSKGLFAQMVGRGLRLHDGKQDCLILDFAGCIEEHGPIDCMADEQVQLLTCGNCREVYSKAVKTCPKCGWRPKTPEIERNATVDSVDREMHSNKPSQQSILSEPENLEVNDVHVNRHRKPNKPDSIKVTYRCGMHMISEWVCLDHDGLAGRKALMWWIRRFGKSSPTVDEALSDMFLASRLNEMTESITAIRRGKFYDITDHQLKVTNVVRID